MHDICVQGVWSFLPPLNFPMCQNPEKNRVPNWPPPKNGRVQDLPPPKNSRVPNSGEFRGRKSWTLPFFWGGQFGTLFFFWILAHKKNLGVARRIRCTIVNLTNLLLTLSPLIWVLNHIVYEHGLCNKMYSYCCISPRTAVVCVVEPGGTWRATAWSRSARRAWTSVQWTSQTSSLSWPRPMYCRSECLLASPSVSQVSWIKTDQGFVLCILQVKEFFENCKSRSVGKKATPYICGFILYKLNISMTSAGREDEKMRK